MGEVRALRGKPAGPLVPLPVPRCGWTEDESTSKCKKPLKSHYPDRGHRIPWGYHLVQCQVINPHADPPGRPMTLDGYPLCCMATDHAGSCCYRRHIAEGILPG